MTLDDASSDERIAAFLDGSPHAVVGASNDRSKYGNRVLRAYAAHGMPVHPVNPHEDEVEGLKAYPDLASLPVKPHGVSVVTPPAVSDAVIEQAGRLGILRVWLQPGAESRNSVAVARKAGVDLIAGGPCVLVALARR